jgi:hypothetical protein
MYFSLQEAFSYYKREFLGIWKIQHILVTEYLLGVGLKKEGKNW